MPDRLWFLPESPETEEEWVLQALDDDEADLAIVHLPFRGRRGRNRDSGLPPRARATLLVIALVLGVVLVSLLAGLFLADGLLGMSPTEEQRREESEAPD